MMNKLILAMLFLSGLNFSAKAGTNLQETTYQVIPLPDEINPGNGRGFTINKNTVLLYPANNAKMKRNAAFLSDYIAQHTGIVLKTAENKGSTRGIILETGLESINAEAYKLVVTAKSIVITGASEAGVFYGIQTLRKSVPVLKKSKVVLPPVVIKDAPRFQYRGMMLDVSRHFFSIDSVKRYIDILALHNINTFHWHLSEDQGWRIEIKKYPRLTEIGSKRAATVIGKNTGKYDGKAYGGFYTQKDVKELIAYAAERYINVIPEIDMPGHMLGALASYPELGCTGGPYEVWQQWGIASDVLCVGNDKTLAFVKDVLTEIMEIFPSRYIHIGGDECPKERWKACPKCQARIKELDLMADEKHSAEERLQSNFIQYVEKIINANGRKLIGWDEILEGGLAPNATVMSWRGMNGGIEAARQGHDVIMTPNSHVYFDHYQSADREKEPLAIGGLSTVEKLYNFEPVPDTLNLEEKKFIIGTQANLWTEYIPTFKHAEYMVLPRIAALCEVQWVKAEKKNYGLFLKRLPDLVGIYDFQNYNYAKHVLENK